MRKILIILLAAVMTAVSTYAAEIEAVSVNLNGYELISNENYLINSTTYVPLNAYRKIAVLNADNIYITADADANYIVANGRCIYNEAENLVINGELCVPVRSVTKAFCGDVAWDGETCTADITTCGNVIESGDTFYDEDELYWLARIIHAESRGEPLKGKIAVGNVIRNRVDSDEFPDSIYDVIFDSKFGIQFTPVKTGAIYNTPTDECVAAAKICLEGYSLSDSIMYFIYEAIATNKWIVYNRPYEMTIGCHDFYS